MKKLIFSLAGICLAAAAFIAVYRFAFRKSIPDAEPSVQVEAILSQNDCFQCHDASAQKPFYGNLPVIGPMLDKHMSRGTRFVDLSKADLEQPSEVLLSKLEYAVRKGSMPIHEYRMIHWGTGFNKKEKSLLSGWILQHRANLYSTGLNAPQFAAEPVQVMPESVPTDPAKVALGAMMYNDTRISLDNTISCASCHILSQGGADEADDRTSEGINGLHGGVNAPTVFNALFNADQFWNGRAHALAEQAAGPPVNPVEMGDQTWDQIVARLRQHKQLVARFKAIYPDEGLTAETVCDAIQEYEMTLITPNDRLDRYFKGESSALTASEIAGYEDFKDNCCAACHVGKTLGSQSFEYMGIFEDYFEDRAETRPDIAYNSDDDGLAGFTGNPADLHFFKVPNLRLVTMTPPYYHDGSRETLEDAVRDMFRFELGKKPSEQTVSSICTFLGALNGESQWW